MLPASTELAPGALVAGYRIDALLGRGGMSVVYLAADLRLKRRVALKLLASPLAEDQAFRTRFLDESQLAASLDHPHIVPIYEAGEIDGLLFIAMRYVEGPDMKQLLSSGPFPPDQAVSFLAQIASALDAAHARGLVHGDVKPSNVLVSAGAGSGGIDHAYLADFGLSSRLTCDGAPTLEGHLLGTIDYVAPERIRGEVVDSRSDLYSLACLVYECLTGAPPFQRPSDVAVLFAHLEEPPPGATELAPELPPAVDAVFTRALAKVPANRYPTGNDLAEAVRSSLGLATDRFRRPWGARHWAITLAAGLAAAVAAVAVFLTTTGGPPVASAGAAVRIDPQRNHVEQRVPVGDRPTVVAAAPRSIWIANNGEGSISRIEAGTGRTAEIPVNGNPTSLAIGGGVVFVATGPPTNNLTLVKAATGGAYDVLRLPDASEVNNWANPLVAAGKGSVWLVDTSGWKLYRINPLGARPRFLGSLQLHLYSPTAEVSDLAVGEGAVWVVGSARDPRLWRIDPRRLRVTGVVRLPIAPRRIVAGYGSVWIIGAVVDEVLEIDARTLRVRSQTKVARGAADVAAGAGSIWVASSLASTVSRIDPSTRDIAATIAVKGEPQSLIASSDGVWVTTSR